MGLRSIRILSFPGKYLMVMMSIDIALRALRSPMIMRIEPITPHQKGNTRDPSIEKMIYYRIERKIELKGAELIGLSEGVFR
ncbi:MAG: hypothetical protein RQ885_06825 [Desulfurococcales archaeon]|nr:hypothetical protein [Desulfurococcales archaeon]